MSRSRNTGETSRVGTTGLQLPTKVIISSKFHEILYAIRLLGDTCLLLGTQQFTANILAQHLARINNKYSQLRVKLELYERNHFSENYMLSFSLYRALKSKTVRYYQEKYNRIADFNNDQVN